MAFWSEKTLPRPHFPETGNETLEALAGRARKSHSKRLLKLLKVGENKALVISLAGNSDYLAHLMVKNSLFMEKLLTNPPDSLFEGLLEKTAGKCAKAKSRAEIMKYLRKLKGNAALLIAAMDVSGAWNLQQITGALSRLADLALQLSLAHLLAEAMKKGDLPWPAGKPEQATPLLMRNCGFVVLSLGKLGSRALNYSSDIDLILLYDQAKVDYRGKHTARHFFAKLAQSLVTIMQERTADGYVFRVDLRLRPDPGTTPPAVSFAAAEVYYQSMAETWERAAMIKVRISAGDTAAGADFLNRIRHFVWRRHIDFAAVQDIHAIKDRILRHYGHRKISLYGHNIKIGEGGIRSVEFFCQIHQLFAGGRNTKLRSPNTRAALAALKEAGIIDLVAASQLSAAYEFLRTLEHRLQMINDEQTQTLPETEEGMAHLATFMGYNDPEVFKTRVLANLSIVKRHYDNLPGVDEGAALPAFLKDRELLERRLFSWGFSDGAADTIAKWRQGTYKALKHPRARKIFDSLLPELLENFSRGANPDQILSHFDDFLSKLPSGVQILSLFQNNPWVFQLIGKIVTTAPYLAEELARRPDLLDFVLDPTFFDPPGGKKELKISLQTALADARDYEEILDGSRKWLNEMRFQIGIQLLESLTSIKEAGRTRANLAEVVLDTLLPEVKKDFKKRNGTVPGSQMAVIALGSFGGRELTQGSDLDLVLLYQAPQDARSKRGKGLPASQYYIRLGQHFLTALSALMGSGKLYDVDLRLRPSGRWGPLVVTLPAFLEYQKSSAWSFEHMALTRARVVLGGARFKAEIEVAIREILTLRRTPAKLARQMDEVRRKYFEEMGSTNIWSVRQVRGGLIDAEYVLQFHLLRNGHKHPDIFNPDFGEALKNLVGIKSLTKNQAGILLEAHDFFLEIHGLLRLCHAENPTDESLTRSLKSLMASATGISGAKNISAVLKETQAQVYALYQQHISRYVKEA
ncbi:MAG: bifunctional [glutamine synthetase] adenylyltransferase/[glutamine synthetase]-adenylyl-L-tyrosine phosphorylase [Proteobacteria bacterium]|nr:bifunctional [glutamine synthetase] adenylyltransferase/[glutamine synthetase]-adenylyl-L-tyrosine phosphorylase [Pseudomonadota bacterium]